MLAPNRLLRMQRQPTYSADYDGIPYGEAARDSEKGTGFTKQWREQHLAPLSSTLLLRRTDRPGNAEPSTSMLRLKKVRTSASADDGAHEAKLTIKA